MKTNKGFSLLEVLITLVLTTIGILGMVTLQNRGVQYTQEAVQRDAAASLTNDLIEIMRAHKDDMFEKRPPAHYSYTHIKNSVASLYNTGGALAINKGSCVSNPQNLAQHAGCWLQKLEDNLPGASSGAAKSSLRLCPSFALSGGEPTCAGAGYKGSSIMIKLAWEARDNACDPNKPANQPSICTYVTRVEL